MMTETNKILKSISFDSYEMLNDLVSGGFNIKLNWHIEESDLISFKIYKAILPQSNLNQKYFIDQKTFERSTQGKFLFTKNSNILYNKDNFVKTNSVILDNTSSKFNDTIQDYQYKFLKEISFNKKQKKYSYIDKNIKFGKGYSYLITFINNKTQESLKSIPLNISTEIVTPPSEPERVFAADSSEGIFLTISCHDNKVTDLLILKRNKEISNSYEFLSKININKGVGTFLDKKVFPGNEYDYKIFSLDYFGNKSLNCKQITKGLNSFFINDATIPYPKVEITKDDNKFIFTIEKNHKNLIGCTIERKDIWKHDLNFQTKSFTYEQWPGAFLFKNKNLIQFKDLILEKNREYQYKITTILPGSRPGAYWFSPILKWNDFEVPQNNINDFKNNSLNISNFKMEIVNNKQNPVFAKFSFNTKDIYDSIILEYDDKKIIIDSYNKTFFVPFEKDKKYKIILSFILNDIKLKVIDNLILNT